MFDTLIEIIFIGAGFKVLKESKEQLKHNIETRDNFSILGQQVIHITLLVIYLLMKPLFPIVLQIFIALNIITLLWILINKENYIKISDKVPAFVDKMIPVAYVLYFSFHFVSPLLGLAML